MFLRTVTRLSWLDLSATRNASTFRRWEVSDYSPTFETLALNESARLPSLRGPKEVLIAVKAASVNPIDVAIAGGYGQNTLRLLRLPKELTSPERVSYDKFPITLGRDFSGTVIRKGSLVTNLNVGDEVWGVITPDANGAHADHVVACSSHITLKPQNLTHVEAASIPYAALTAYSALAIFGQLNQANAYNKRVLVLGGSGGVGTLAIQLLKAWGAFVSTTCSADAMDWLREQASPDHLIDYKSNELHTLQNSYDFVFDAASNRGQTIDEDALKSLRKWTGSKYVTISSPLLRNFDKGYISGGARNLLKITTDTVRGITEGVSVRWAFFVPSQGGLEQIKNLVEESKIKPVVEKVFNFDQVPESYRKVKDGHARGKSVITLTANKS